MIARLSLALRLLPTAAILMTVGVSCPSSAYRAGTTTPFSADSPFNTTITSDAAIDPRSQPIVESVTREEVHAGLIEFGIPIYEVDDSTTRYNITCQEPISWGPCPLEGVSVPIPGGARPQ